MKVFLKTAVITLSGAFPLICLIFDDLLDLIASNMIITPRVFLAAAFANATAVGVGFLFVPLFIVERCCNE